MVIETQNQVIIVGGGPVGVGLALELALQGVRSIVVEKRSVLHKIPKGQNLTQRTVEHFQRWGIENELHAAATVSSSLGKGTTAYGNLLSGISYEWLQRDSVGDYYSAKNLRLPQYQTEMVLRRRTAEFPEIELRLGWEAIEILQDVDGVNVMVREETTGTTKVLRGVYAVGTDGARSTVREQVGITQTVNDHDLRMALLVFRSNRLDEIVNKHFPGVGFINVIAPEFNGYWQFFGRVDMGSEHCPPSWFFHAPIEPIRDYAFEDLKRVIETAVSETIDVDFEYSGTWDLRFAVADTYRNERVFIAGDACHSHPPYGGYGVNNGLEDARNLGWKLGAAMNGWAGPNLLDSYSLERQPIFVSVARDFIEKSIQNDRLFLARFSPKDDPSGFRAEWTRRAEESLAEVARYAPHYSGSPIVAGGKGEISAVGNHQRTARPGHHLSPSSEKPVAVYGFIEPTAFTLFSNSKDTLDMAESEAAHYGIPLNRLLMSTQDARRYGAASILVRPDGFIAWISEEAGVTFEAGLAAAIGL